MRAFFEEHGEAPSKFKHAYKIRRNNGEIVSKSELIVIKKAVSLQNACHRQGGYASIRKEAGVPIA